MKILIATILLPYPLDSGGAQAQYNMIDGLRREHTITLVYPENSHNCAKAASHLRRVWPEVTLRPYTYAAQYSSARFALSKVERMCKLLLMRHSDSFKIERILKPYGYDLTPRFGRFVRRAVRESGAELVQVEFYPYLHVADLLPEGVKTVFVHHELRYVRNERMLEPFRLSAAQRAELSRQKADEIATLNRYDKVVTLTDQDRQQLVADGVTAPIAVSPAAVSTEVCPLRPWEGSLSFLGGAGHGPNKEGIDWLSDRVFPLIDWKAQGRDVSFKVVGKGWTEADVRHFPAESLRILGFVPRLETEIAGSILLVPILSGSGMRMKLLEGAAMGLPIVTTTVGAEGLLFEDGVNCLKADTPEDFARAITRLTADAALRKTLSENAQRLFEAHYSKQALVRTRNAVYESI